ncbi:MAG: hypothetical protein PHN88_10140 [Ignavibacteria bacterium]|nr:hypothetical protein [Ignavibacteria bacterium]
MKIIISIFFAFIITANISYSQTSITIADNIPNRNLNNANNFNPNDSGKMKVYGSFSKDTSGFELYMALRIGGGGTYGDMENTYKGLFIANVQVMYRLFHKFYSGLSVNFMPRLTSFSLNSRYTIYDDYKNASIYTELGLGLYSSVQKDRSITSHSVYSDRQLNPGGNIGIGVNIPIGRDVMIDLNGGYHAYYDSRYGGNTNGFSSILAGFRFILR